MKRIVLAASLLSVHVACEKRKKVVVVSPSPNSNDSIENKTQSAEEKKFLEDESARLSLESRRLEKENARIQSESKKLAEDLEKLQSESSSLKIEKDQVGTKKIELEAELSFLKKSQDRLNKDIESNKAKMESHEKELRALKVREDFHKQSSALLKKNEAKYKGLPAQDHSLYMGVGLPVARETYTRELSAEEKARAADSRKRSCDPQEAYRICEYHWGFFGMVWPEGRVFKKETSQRSFKELQPQLISQAPQADQIVEIQKRTVLATETLTVAESSFAKVRIISEKDGHKFEEIWDQRRFVSECVRNFREHRDPASPFATDAIPRYNAAPTLDPSFQIEGHSFPSNLESPHAETIAPDYFTLLKSTDVARKVYDGAPLETATGRVEKGDPFTVRTVTQMTIVKFEDKKAWSAPAGLPDEKVCERDFE